MTIATTCRRCGQEFEPDHGAIVAGAWRLCPTCRDADPPRVDVTAQWSARSRVWLLNVTCPFCGARHQHGGGDGPEPDLGARRSHCVDGAGGSYDLVKTVAEPTEKYWRVADSWP